MRLPAFLVITAAVATAATVGVGAQSRQTIRPAIPAYDDGAVEVLPLQGSLFLIAGTGANVTVQNSDEGFLLIDSSSAEAAPKILEALRTIAPDKPIRLIISTSTDEARTSGNAILSESGRNIWAGVGGGAGREPSRLEGAPIIAHENALLRMSGLSGEPERLPYGVRPHDTFFGEKKSFFYGGEPVEIIHQPAAHSDSDLMVWFRKSDVVAAGSLYSTVEYPRIELARGGSVQGTLDALNDILDIAVPQYNNQGGTLIVPGRGRISNESDVAEYRDMVTIIVDRVRAMVDEGLTLAQVKARRPSLDYDGIYGNPGSDWTADMFLEAVYTDLVAKRTPPAPAGRRGR
ncbi:MAG: hypothetical protein AB7G23_01570 [Vicinamibacterales bacterium]